MKCSQIRVRTRLAIIFTKCICFIILFPVLALIINSIELYLIREKLIEELDNNLKKLK